MKFSYNILEDQEFKMYPKHLPHAVRFGYSMGHVLNDLCASMWFTYSLVFYTAVIGMSHSKAGMVMVVGQVADAVSTPVIGALSDRGSVHTANPNQCGNRKPWYIIGTILIVCSKPFMFAPCMGCEDSSDLVKLGYFSVFVIIFQIGWAAVQTVHLAMAVDITSDEKERTFILSLRNTMTAICNSATYIGQWIAIEISGHGTRQVNKDDVGRFQLIIGAIIIVGIITSIIFLVMVPETTTRELCLEDHHPVIMTKKLSIKDTLKKWQLHYIGFIYMNARIFVVAVQALLTLYLHETLGAMTYELATVPLVLNVVCFCASLAVGPLSGSFGHSTTFIIGAAFGIGASLWTYFGTGQILRLILMYLSAVFYGIACALMQVAALSLVADHIGQDVCSAAFIYGYMSFLDKISTGLTLALVLHFHPGEGNSNYFTVAVANTCGISCALAMVAVLLLPSRFANNNSKPPSKNKNLQK